MLQLLPEREVITLTAASHRIDSGELSKLLAHEDLKNDLQSALDILETRPDWKHEDIGAELDRDFFSQPGRHGLIGGRTRTGKTTLIYHLTDGILSHGKEHIATLDTGKSSEFLTNALFQPLRILVPKGLPRTQKMDLSIELNPDAPDTLRKKYGFTDAQIGHFLKNFDNSVVVPIDVRKEVWPECRKGEIAVVSIKRFIPDPYLYSRIVADMATDLIYATWDHVLRDLPFCFIMDEAQQIAPSRKNCIVPGQLEAGKIIGSNLEVMASMGVRFLLGAQGYGKLLPTVRDNFEWIFIKRGIRFFRDVGRLYDFEPLWNKVPTTHTYIARPDGSFTDPYRVPIYPAGWELGTVRYNGRLDGSKLSKKH